MKSFQTCIDDVKSILAEAFGPEWESKLSVSIEFEWGHYRGCPEITKPHVSTEFLFDLQGLGRHEQFKAKTTDEIVERVRGEFLPTAATPNSAVEAVESMLT